MKIWKKTDSRTKLGVALYNYKNDGDHMLHLDIGDTVQILEETEDWFRGFATKNKFKKGIFPRNYISLKEASVVINGSLETVTSKEHPMVIELTTVLREWHTIWKQMFVERNSEMDSLKEKITELIDWRQKILARKFTVDELRGIQQKVTALIDDGNALLKLDLVVRDDSGNILNPERTSIIEIYKRHVEAADKLHSATRNRDSDIETRPANWPTSFNIFIRLRNFVCKIVEDSEILINLFDARQEQFICENYMVKWGKQGTLKDIDILNNFRVVFTDLGTKDGQRDKVFLIFQIIRLGVMNPKGVDNKKQTQGIRRPFGVAALDISEYIQGVRSPSEDIDYFVPFQSCGEKEFMFNVIKKVITAKDINHKGQGAWVSLKILPGDMKQIRDGYPHLINAGTAIARKMGFPDVIMPGDVRNDIYLTLKQGEFTKGPTKSTDKNVEVSMVVCNSKGETLQNVISQGCSEAMVSEYKSMVYYHEDKPKWYETVKVTISTDEEFSGLHLKFLFRHKCSNEAKDRSEKPFAMSYVRLMNDNGTTLEDRVHELLVYKIENKKYDDPKVYLKLPSSKQDLDTSTQATHPKQAGGLTLSSKDYFHVNSYVCSTKLTHNVNLLGLLKWHEVLEDVKALKLYLEHLMKEGGDEIVKFLQDLLDSLFNVLMQNINNDSCDNLVFDALVYIIDLISDRKYHQFRPVLDAYIDSSFSFAMAYNKLIAILKDYLDKANENSNPLLQAIKSLEYIFKFIIKSRQLFSRCNEGWGKQQFEISLMQLLTAINNVMVYRTDATLFVQGAALKYISSIIGDVMTVFDPLQLSMLVVKFINNLAPDRLSKQKMKCIDQLIQTKLFDNPACREILLPAFLQHTNELMMQKEEMDECISILSHIMDLLWKTESPRDQDVKIIMDQVLRTVIQSVVGMEQSTKEVRTTKSRRLEGNCVGVMMSILRQMTEKHFASYIASFATPFDLLDFLMEILCVFKDLVNRKVYPTDWLEIIMIQNSVVLRALRFFATTIFEHFSNPFEEQLWNNFFHCAIAFLTQECLQLEKFSVSKRNKIVARYKDMRRETGFEIRTMWYKLGPNRIHFIPQLVGPFLEMTLIQDIELRKATIPLFYDMMEHEFLLSTTNTAQVEGNFNKFENEMITKLDTLIEGGRGDEQYMKLFTETLEHYCEGNERLVEQGLQFVSTVHDLLERLLVYRSIIQDEIREHRMSCIVNLLDFYHDINRQEMYVRYLHKLYDLHLGCDNYTEAAYTLILYTKLLTWSDEPLPSMLHNKSYTDALTHRDLKERLYYDIISNFDKGEMWEKALELCEELCDLYKNELFDYKSLGEILKRQAELYSCIMTKMRPKPEYFRVGYFGQGFPSFLQNKVFIYRGKACERLPDFNSRMQMLFPNAELMMTLDDPDIEVSQSNKQYLQINAVTPVMDLKERFEGKDINEQILQYYRVNEVQTFSFSRRSDESVKDVTEMWLERTSMKTAYPFPGIVGWFVVTYVETLPVSPIENAIETIQGKNKDMLTLVEHNRSDLNLIVSPLSQVLNGVVDPAVSGGIANYKNFYTGDFDPELVEKLKESTVEQVNLCREGLIIHKQKIPESLQPLHLHMEQRFTEMCSMIEKEYGIKVADKGILNTTLRRKQTLPSSVANRTSDLSVSSLNLDSRHNRSPRPSLASITTLRNPATRSQSVWVKEKSNSQLTAAKSSHHSKVSLSTLKKRVSQVTEQLAEGGNRNSSSESSRIELSEQLTPKRPPRPDTERRPSRPSSTQMRYDCLHKNSGSENSLASNQSNNTVTSLPSGDINDLEASEAPPPLPEKQSYVESNDVVRRVSSVSHGGNRAKPSFPLPPSVLSQEAVPPPLPAIAIAIDDDDDDEPPPVPPKPSH